MARHPAVYILASRQNGTLYVGVTAHLVNRIWQHRNGTIEGFSRRYRIDRLVYYECYSDMPTAIRREKQIKKWRRRWKLALIERENPYWDDLWECFVLISGFPLPGMTAVHPAGCGFPLSRE
ncbi:MAG: GIY-YIG nuclease family protein [Halioglobus sp.]|nr:GIY-YIG nuclease family protein [Halioglobus sp.]